MNRHECTFFLLSIGAFALLVGCTQKELPQEAEVHSSQIAMIDMPKNLEEIPWELQPEAAPLPEGMKLEKRALFYLDTETPTFKVTLRGNKRFSLLGTREDRLGRRSIQLETPTGTEEVAPSGWHMPPAGAMSPNGNILVCYNRLVGKTSRITEGMMPDPTLGVLGFCRLRTERGWQEEFQVGSLDRIANWVKTVTALERGAFRVQYQADDGWFFDPDERHSIMVHTIENGMISRTSFVRPLFEDRP